MDKCVRFTLKKTGTVTEAIGFAGVGCTAAVESLLNRMQAVPEGVPTFTADYHAAPNETDLELENPGG